MEVFRGLDPALVRGGARGASRPGERDARALPAGRGGGRSLGKRTRRGLLAGLMLEAFAFREKLVAAG